jgi:hypothetical protein
MTSWIKTSNQKKRVFKNLEEINNENINTSTQTNSGYEPYLFDYNEGRRLTNIIKEFGIMKLNNVNKIVNVYQPYYKNNVPAAGLGDYIRGSIFLYQYCKIINVNFEMNINNHMLNSVLDNKYNQIKKYYLENIEHSSIINYHPGITKLNDVNLYIDTINNINNYISRCMIDDNGVLYVCMKTYPIFKITDDDKLFIKDSLKNNKILEIELNKQKQKYNIVPKMYNIIHIRSGDKYLIDNNTVSSTLIEEIFNVVGDYINKNNDKQLILIGDCNVVLNMIVEKYPQLINFNNNISHMGEGVHSTYDNIKNNMIEFYIMGESSSIFSLSSYYHGSGFSKWCAEINNIPYTTIFLNS